MSTASPSRRRRPGRFTTPLARMAMALRYPDFRVLWLSTVSNQLGWGMQQVLLGWLVFDMTGSAGMVGAVFAARSAPNLIVGLVAGSITDRFDRRAIMRLSCAAMLVLSMLASWLLFADGMTIWLLLGTTFMLGAAQAFYMTSRQVYVYDIVGGHRAINGIALVSLAQWVGGIIGSLLTGGLIAFQGPAVAFLVMGLTYGVGIVIMIWLRHAGSSAPLSREPILENLVNYFRALKSNRAMLSLIISTAGAEVLGFSHQVMLPILAREVLGVGAFGLGLLTAFRFLGSAIGVFTVAAMERVRRKGVLLLCIIGMFGVGEILLGQSPFFWVAVICVMFINLLASATDILHHTLLQLSVSNEQRGRAMGSWIFGIGMAPLGQLEVGFLAGETNSRTALLVNGTALIVLAAVMGALMPRLRRL
ncbi:MAG: MFS transporter [Chloroflexi bacterium]|nr:MFS transporter [Chloroflexota bacterium]